MKWLRKINSAMKGIAAQQAAAAKKRQDEQNFLAAVRARQEAEDALGADGRLERAYDRLLAGEIDLAGYRDIILDEQTDMKERRKSLRAERRMWDPDDYEDEMADIDDDERAIGWRLGWVKKRLAEEAAKSKGTTK